MGYKTLLIRDSERLRLYLDNISVETKNGELRFLISDLKYLIVDNYKSTMSVQLINKLVQNNVSVILCGLDHLPASQIMPISGHYESSGKIMSQINWDENIKKELHQKIIKAKIASQIDILRKNGKSDAVIAKLREFYDSVDSDDSTNREGLAAKMYFREMYGKDFVRFNDDIINAGLNYGYAILRSMICSIIASKGLLLNIGIFHRGKTNNNNLADDIIEVYRSIVDDYVLNHLMQKELLLLEDRDNLIRLMDSKIMMSGKMYSINNTVEMYVESIIKCFEERDGDNFCAPSLAKIIAP